MDLLYFILLVGVLIFVHELGHFAWAKFFGVKVLRFSLGFGPTLAGFRKGDTEYVIAAVPLGGYVKMLGESPSDVVGPEDELRSFSSQPLWKRVVIVCAGPAMNLVFPIVLYFVVFLGDATLPPPLVGTVFPDRPAAGRLVPGDVIVSVDGQAVSTFTEVRRIVEDSPDRTLSFVVDRHGERVAVGVTPTLERVPRPLELYDEVGRIGVMPHLPTPVVGVLAANRPAGGAQMRTFDVVISAGGRPIDTWLDLATELDENRGSLLPLTYLRPTRIDRPLGGLVELDVYEPHVASLTPEPGDGAGPERAGLELADLYVSHVTEGSPEHRMGLLPGDRLLSLDGRPVRHFTTFLEDLEAGRGEEHELTWRRGDRTLTQRFRLRHERGVNEHGQPFDRYVVGMRNWVPMRLAEGVDNPSPVAYAVREAVDSTTEMMELTIFSVVRLFQGRLTYKSIGGPLTIFEVAGTAAREGTLNYLALMAFISINLGLINLLPIPLLDGGHLIIFLVEAVSRRRLTMKVRQYAALTGLVLLIGLMVLAFANDIERQWPNIVDMLTSG
jgi:regulator of sigma E protease